VKRSAILLLVLLTIALAVILLRKAELGSW
jgi:hypothetical protein